MAKLLEHINLQDIAPPSIAGDKNIQDLFKAIDPNLRQVSEAISEAFIISRIRELPEPVLDLLAWQWHVDFYELAKNIDAKRDMVLGSIAWHRKKGTRWAIIKALEMLGVEAKFISWQEEGADPYTFAIEAKLTPDFWVRVDWTKPTQTIRRAIFESKAARSWMSRLYVYFEDETDQNIYAGAIVGQSINHDIVLILNNESDTSQDIAVATTPITGINHDLGLFIPVRQDEDLRIYSAAGVFQGITHSLGILTQTQSQTMTELITGCVISCGAEFNISMAA